VNDKFKFSDEEKNKIKEAVQDLESVSSGELVIHYENRSDDYSESYWYSATLFGLMSIGLAALFSYFWMIPKGTTILEISMYQVLFVVVGFIIPRLFPWIRLSFISNAILEHRVNRRALEVFVREEIFNTRDRTGILFYISRLEHKVVVLGDSGINNKVKNEDWEEVVNLILSGIKKDSTTEGIVKAIGKCKELLVNHNFMRREDDTNELSDELRLGDS